MGHQEQHGGRGRLKEFVVLELGSRRQNSAGEEVFFADSGCADNYHLVYIESGSTRYDRYSGNVALTEDDSYTFTAQMGAVDDLQATVDFTVF